MNKRQKIVGIIAFGAIGICFGCTRSIDYTNGEEVFYFDLPLNDRFLNNLRMICL